MQKCDNSINLDVERLLELLLNLSQRYNNVIWMRSGYLVSSHASFTLHKTPYHS
jgi:trehalose-6-phosphatase